MGKRSLNYASLLTSPNVKAFLRVIREGESNQLDEGPHSGYRAMYHPRIKLWWESELTGPHPRRAEPLPDGSGRKSTAFGAYQFVWTTWMDLLEKYDGLEDDIRPYMQDCYAIALIYDVGALDDVIDGKFDLALAKCGAVWASLPMSALSDGGSKVAYQRALSVWKAYGGGELVVVASSAPIEDRSTQARPEDIQRINEQENEMAAPLMLFLPAAMQAITQMIPALSTLFGKNAEKVQEKVGAATQIVDIITKATGAPNAQAAVEAMTNDPAKLEVAKAAVLGDPVISMMLTEVGGGGITGARAAAADPNQAPLHKNGAFIISLLFVLMMFFVVTVVLIVDKNPTPELKVQVVQAVIGLVMMAGAFWLGTTYGSARKTEIMATK